MPREGLLQPLDRNTCLRLLRGAVIGRVAWDAGDGRISVLPVNFVVDGDSVVFRSAEGGKLAAARKRRTASFEVDDVEPALRTGWSVLVSGTAEVVGDAAAIRRLERLPLAPWPPMAPESRFVRIRLEEVTGRLLPLRPGHAAHEYIRPGNDIA